MDLLFSCFHLYDTIATYGTSGSSLLNIGVSALWYRKGLHVYSYHTRPLAFVEDPMLTGKITSSNYLSAPLLSIINLMYWKHMVGTQHITKHGSSWTCSMPFNIYPSALQEYHPMKTPSNPTESSEPWNMIAKIAHDETANALRMLSHFGSGYVRVISCRMSHVNVQTGRLPFTAG